MHKYKIRLSDGSESEFESELYLPEMPIRDFGGGKFVFFEDAGVGFNLNGAGEI